MGWWRWISRRIEVLFRPRAAEAELDEEIRQHVELETAANVRSGMSPAEGRRKALSDFGGVERFKEEVRDVRGARIIADIVQDARVALRSLPKQPAFLIAVVVTLAVGIGGSLAMFAVLDASLLRSLPYPGADRLVLGRSTFDGELGPYVSAQDFEDYRDQTVGLEALGAIAPFPARTTVTGAGDAERIDMVVVSPDFFEVLGVDPLIGRHFRPEEAAREAEPVVMLSYGYWQRRFGGDPAVEGTRIVLGGVPHTVVGVMPRGFRFYLDTDAWRPYHLGTDYATGRQIHNFLLVGRLEPGWTVGRVQATADAVSAALEAAYPSSNEGKALLLSPLRATLVEGYLSTLTILTVSAVLILLVACANVAGLLLARGNARRAEFAVRTVMGAGSARLARQLLTESALLAGAAGLAGVFLGVLASKGILAFVSLDFLGELEVGLSGRTVGAALAISAGTVVLFGLPPSVRAVRQDPAKDLRSGSRTSVGPGATRFRDGLVVVQLALTALLLGLSGLLLRSFAEIRNVDLGFDANSLVTAEVQVPGSWELAERINFFTELESRIRAVPGVAAVAMGSHLPVRDPGNTMGIQRAHAGSPDELRNTTVSQRMILPGYFRALGIPLLAGRPIDSTDRATSEPVIVLSESTARRLFGDEDAIGRTVHAMESRDFVPRTVVGVVADVVLGSPVEGPDMAMYFPYTQLTRTRMRIAMRVRGDAGAVTGSVRRILSDMDPNVPLDDVRTMDQAVASAVSDRRGTTVVLLVFAATALVLAGIGLYGVLAYRVSLRLREIGIRMALGASAGRVTAGIVRNGLRLVAIGLVLGSVSALMAGRVMSGMLFGVTGHDAVTFALLTLVLTGVGVMACVLPAHRASRVRPTDVMRTE